MPQNLIRMSSVVLLLTLAHAGGAEDYCNHSVCLLPKLKQISNHTLILCDKMFRLKFAAFYKNNNFLVSLLYQ